MGSAALSFDRGWRIHHERRENKTQELIGIGRQVSAILPATATGEETEQDRYRCKEEMGIGNGEKKGEK